MQEAEQIEADTALPEGHQGMSGQSTERMS